MRILLAAFAIAALACGGSPDAASYAGTYTVASGSSLLNCGSGGSATATYTAGENTLTFTSTGQDTLEESVSGSGCTWEWQISNGEASMVNDGIECTETTTELLGKP